MNRSRNKNIRFGLGLLVWLCLTLFLAYVLLFPEVLCDIGFGNREWVSGLCSYAYRDSFGIPSWHPFVFLPTFLFISASLISFFILFLRFVFIAFMRWRNMD